ncbi:MAG: hypothetical protein KDA98_05080 [Acidimicrobiales bacterium]|nr:hypothetical protein [Acidimicrobiales bacterium]
MKRARFVAVAAVMAMALTSCKYYDLAVIQRDNGDPVPWWCRPTEERPVTDGPASGSVDWYAGTHKAALGWDACLELSAQFDAAKEYALQWPTRAEAEADGWREVTGYVSGMGTHHVRGGITPEMLADESFDPDDPILDAVGLDDVFDPARPEVLQFDGNGPDARLVGFDYYVRTDTGLPPEGFEGNNDWWHHHPVICHRLSDARMIGFNIGDASCDASGGVNVTMANYYMLHVWVLDDMQYKPDVYAGMIPCISGGTAIRDDPGHPCHSSRTGSGAMTMVADDQQGTTDPSWMCGS